LSDHTKANGAHTNNAIRSAAATMINRSFIYYIL
jgi:t-SNARE complex subunit (syntaxin)